MSLFDGLKHRLYVLVHGRAYEREIERETRFHIELETLSAPGERSQRNAELGARRNFGNVTYYREEMRRMTPLAWFEGLRQDISYAWRGVRRAPAFALMVITTMALGLGVNAAMFSLLDHLLIQTPPGVVRANEVRRLYISWTRPSEPGGREAFDSFTYPHVRAIAAEEDSTLAIAAVSSPDSILVADGDRRVTALRSVASRGYFSLLGVQPEKGRFFSPEEDEIATPTRVLVISDAFWHNAFNANPAVLGRVVHIHGEPYTIIGVAQPQFAGIDLDRADVWAPLNTDNGYSGMPGPWYETFGASFTLVTRVRSPAIEQRMLEVATRAIREVHIKGLEYDSTARVIAGPIVHALGPMKREQEVSVATRVGGVAIIVLLIATANVVNLLLLRAARRKREIALRRALGVSQSRLVRQLAVESTLLVVIGGAAAALLSIWIGGALRKLVLPNVHWSTSALDLRTALLLGATSVAIGVLAGLAPALQTSRIDLADSLKAGGRDTAYQRSSVRSGLVMLQAALCTILLVGTGLFVNSLRNMESIGLGYSEMDHVLVARPKFDDDARHATEIAAALPLVVDRLNHIRGLTAAYASDVPLGGWTYASVFLPGRPDLPKFAADPYPTGTGVSAGYFRAAGIAIKLGREFSAADLTSAAKVVIVSETMARVDWPNERAVGKCLILGDRTDPCSTVIGVAADAHRREIVEKPVQQYYVPGGAPHWAATAIIARVPQTQTVTARRAIDQALKAELPSVAWTSIKTLADVIDPELRPWQLGATLFSSLAILSILVAAVGIYSVTAYGVSQRAHEMGVRLALGARTSNILDLVVGDGLTVVGVGIVVGIVLSLLLGRLVRSLLFGITTSDPSVLIATVVVLGAVSGVATIIPAWRATRVDPATVLRAD